MRCCAGLTTAIPDMFDLWFPAALGAQAVMHHGRRVSRLRGLPPDDIELCGGCCWICWPTARPGRRGRAVSEMIARIVEAYGPVVQPAGPVVLVVSGTQAMALDELEERSYWRAALRSLRH